MGEMQMVPAGTGCIATMPQPHAACVSVLAIIIIACPCWCQPAPFFPAATPVDTGGHPHMAGEGPRKVLR